MQSLLGWWNKNHVDLVADEVEHMWETEGFEIEKDIENLDVEWLRRNKIRMRCRG